MSVQPKPRKIEVELKMPCDLVNEIAALRRLIVMEAMEIAGGDVNIAAALVGVKKREMERYVKNTTETWNRTLDELHGNGQ